MITIASLFLLVVTAHAGAGKWEVHSRYENPETFKRIGEYLGGKERYSFRLVMRSQNDSRGGYYWIVRRGHTRVYMPKGGKFVLEYYPEGSGTAIKHEYPLRRISHERTIFLGVTGDDWPSDKAKPLAWRIQLQDANGKVLEAKQSYLWEFPSN